VERSEPPQQEGEDGRRGTKAAGAFRTTREVAEALDLPPHVLRFWEVRFPQVKPLKRAGGRRYYRPADVDLLRRIRECLYQQGYTIKGVQKLLRDDALRAAAKPAAAPEDRTPVLFALEPPSGSSSKPGLAACSRPALHAALKDVREELLEIRALLRLVTSEGGPPVRLAN
jgi:DNA-binding transcriptional MerR regulator